MKGEERKLKNKIVEYNLQLHAHNGCGFDTWVILNNLPCDKHIIDIIKNGKGFNFIKIFKGYIHNGKKTNSSISNFQMCYDTYKLFFKKIGKTFKLQKESLKKI